MNEQQVKGMELTVRSRNRIYLLLSTLLLATFGMWLGWVYSSGWLESPTSEPATIPSPAPAVTPVTSPTPALMTSREALERLKARPVPTIDPGELNLPPLSGATTSPSSSASESISEPMLKAGPTPEEIAAAVALVPELIIPVAGIKPGQLRDTYNDSRSQVRQHNAIDIMAPQGAPVVAAADGKIARLFYSELGGVTIYQLSANQRIVFYYAHLERYAEGLLEGQSVRQGDLIGYVGDTGNAGAGNYHLHFAIWAINDPRRLWNGINVNPFPLLRGSMTK